MYSTKLSKIAMRNTLVCINLYIRVRTIDNTYHYLLKVSIEFQRYITKRDCYKCVYIKYIMTMYILCTL